MKKRCHVQYNGLYFSDADIQRKNSSGLEKNVDYKDTLKGIDINGVTLTIAGI